MHLESGDTVEAVVLMEGDSITRELLYPEFEAILDSYVSEPHFKNKTVKAVYLVINSSLCVTAAVFFVIEFNEEGMADQRWNVPLRALAEAATAGPDLGAGPIRLACFSQCAIELQRNNLWDPQMEPSNNGFTLLKKTIKANRLGLSFKAQIKPQAIARAAADRRKSSAESAQTIKNDQASKSEQASKNEQTSKNEQILKKQLHAHYSQELRNRLASELKDQRLRIASLQSNHQDTLKNLLKEHQQRVRVYQENLHSLQEQNAELKKQNATIKETLDIQAGKVQGIREYYAHKLKLVQSDETSQVQSAQENIALEVELKIQAATRELSETLDMRNVELFYRHQNETSLREEIVELKKQYQSLLSSSGEQLLTRLNQAGVSFVVFHHGVGQFSVALEDLSLYLDNPDAFAARKLDISAELYSGWLSHYQKPVCNALDAEGHLCGKFLSKIDSPLKFHLGESDRCDQHQIVS